MNKDTGSILGMLVGANLGAILGAILGGIIGFQESVGLMFFDYSDWGFHRVGWALVGAGGVVVGGGGGLHPRSVVITTHHLPPRDLSDH